MKNYNNEYKEPTVEAKIDYLGDELAMDIVQLSKEICSLISTGSNNISIELYRSKLIEKLYGLVKKTGNAMLELTDSTIEHVAEESAVNIVKMILKQSFFTEQSKEVVSVDDINKELKKYLGE